MINKTKWGFATMTALTLMFSQGAGAVTQAFAADGTTAQTQTTTTNTGSSTNTGSALNPTTGSTTPSTSATQTHAGLLPDNFFYFVKLMVEKIDLAFTSNDAAKAKLLSQFAAERIAEANALIQKGETDQAAQALQKAIDQQEQAVSLTNPTTTNTSDPTNATSGNTTATTTSGDASTATTSGDATTTTAPSNQSSPTSTTTDQGSAVGTTSGTTTTGTNQTAGTTTVSNPTTTTGQTATSTGSALPTNTQDLKNVNPKVANNITALLNALQHIKNPKAQESLIKNIQKSFAKLGLKLDKQPLDEANHQVADGEKDAQDSTASENDQNQPKQEEDAVKDQVKKATEKAAKAKAELAKKQAEVKAELAKKQAEVKAELAKKQAEAKAELAKKQAEAKAELAKKQAEAKAKAHHEAKKVKSYIEKRVNEHQDGHHEDASESFKEHGHN
jgi:hypothetical protein